MRIVRASKNVEDTKKPAQRKDVTAASKAEAVEYIRSAISVLGNSAVSGDKESKEAIANLSVILFDLK